MSRRKGKPTGHWQTARVQRPPETGRIVLAAGTVDGAGTTIALQAALRAPVPHGAVALVPPAFVAEATRLGWSAQGVSTGRALLGELVGAGRATAWIGFCDRLPLLRRGRTCDVLVVQNPHLYEASTLEGTLRQRLRLAVLRRWARASAARATVIVCSTPSSADAVVAATGADRARVRVEPIPAIDVGTRKTSHREQIERVLLVGDVYGYKRLDVATDAVAEFATRQHRQVAIVHIGTVKEAGAAADLDGAMARASQAGLDVIRLGRTDHSAVLDAMVDADVLLLTSTLETQGLPLREAQAVGLPVVARGIGPFADVAGDAAVLTAVDADAETFSAALASIDSRSARAALSAKGSARNGAAEWWPLLDHVRASA
jgi:glycosyltransferase involved in cell wall biosynthesis